MLVAGGCEWGDRTPHYCSSIMTERCYAIESRCCKTCHDRQTNDPGHSFIHLFVPPPATDRCGGCIMISGCPSVSASVRASVRACILLARYLTNQWTKWLGIEGRRVKVKVTDGSNIWVSYCGRLAAAFTSTLGHRSIIYFFYFAAFTNKIYASSFAFCQIRVNVSNATFD